MSRKRTYTVEVTIEVEDGKATYRGPLTQSETRRLVRELVHKGWIDGGAYSATVTRISAPRRVA